MAKLIFNSTEKSNFILNMKTHEYQKFLLRILLGLAVLTPLFSLPLEFAKLYSVPGMAIAIIGVLAMVFVLIGFMKKVTPKTLFLPAGLLGGMAVWSLISAWNSYFYNVSVFGADGRSEGVLSVIFYGCLFLLGAQLGKASNQQKLLNGLLWMGLAECAWGLLQALPIGMLSYYKDLEPLLVFRTFLPSGLTGSPIFLAILLNLLTLPAMLGAAFAEEKKQRIFYTICTGVFVLFSVKTQCLIGLAAPAAALLGLLIYGIVKHGGKRLAVSAVTAVLAFAVGLGWVYVSPSMNGTLDRLNGTETVHENGIVLYDAGIMWKDSSYRLEVSGYYVPDAAECRNGTFDAADLGETYGFLWRNTASVMGKYPIVGTGPDNLVYPQMYQSHKISANANTFDRCYNYYLHLGATMGVPVLLMFAVLMGWVLVRGAKGCKGGTWLTAGIFGAVVLYLLMMVIGTSAVTVAPFFWMLAGCAAGGAGEKE
ncbi:MAG: O-antigen ligase family protein [Oscillospiraceae bacterium]|nr:O-antigen ligase family protein [Oscillospiraceae bacterium]